MTNRAGWFHRLIVNFMGRPLAPCCAAAIRWASFR